MYQGQKMNWMRFKSHGAAKINPIKSVTLNTEGIGSIHYYVHNDFLSDANYSTIANAEMEKTIVLINTDYLSHSILDEDETIVLAMAGHVLTKDGMCEIMTAMKVDDILEKGFG